MITDPKLQQATELYSAGRQTEATAIFREIMAKTTSPAVFLNAVQGFVVSASRLEDTPELLKRTSDGIKVATELKAYDSLAYLLATKAQFISDNMGIMEYNQNNITLVPRWMGFSTERDQKLFNDLDEKVNKSKKEINELTQRALQIATETKNKDVEGHIHTEMGSYYGAEYLRIRGKNVSKNDRFRFLYKFHFILHRGYDRYFMYSKECRQELRDAIRNCMVSFEKAIACYIETKDKNAEAYAHYNYAIQLGSMAKFRLANRTLNKAEKLAKEMDNKSLQGRIVLLRKSHKSKNSDVPNYLEGETRNTEEEVIAFVEKMK